MKHFLTLIEKLRPPHQPAGKNNEDTSDLTLYRKISWQKGLLLATTFASTLAIAENIFAEDAPLTASVDRVSLEVAHEMAWAAIQACRQEGVSVSVTVVDRNGVIQTQLRDTVAPPVSLGISFKKAYTSANFNAKGSALKANLGSGLPFADSNLVFMAGSVPIRAAGKLYGAIGVSGAPSGDLDEKCALKGLESRLEDLEMGA